MNANTKIVISGDVLLRAVFESSTEVKNPGDVNKNQFTIRYKDGMVYYSTSLGQSPHSAKAIIMLFNGKGQQVLCVENGNNVLNLRQFKFLETGYYFCTVKCGTDKKSIKILLR